MRHMRVLEMIDAVARFGSIRRAADRMNFNASALTRRINDLETELDAQLFERTARGMRLTPEGELFVGHARRQLSEMQQLQSELENMRGLRRGRIRIACSQAVALNFLPRLIGGFRRQYPDVEFELSVVGREQAEQALRGYDADLALVVSPGPMQEFRQLARIEQRLVALLPDDHALTKRTPLRLRDCAPYPVALPDRSTGGRQLVDAFSAKTGVQFQVVVESNSFEMLRQSVIHSGLLSFQIEVGAPEKDAEPGLLVKTVDRRDAAAADLVLGQLLGRELPLAADVFAAHVAEQMKKRSYAASRRRRK